MKFDSIANILIKMEEKTFDEYQLHDIANPECKLGHSLQLFKTAEGKMSRDLQCSGCAWIVSSSQTKHKCKKCSKIFTPPVGVWISTISHYNCYCAECYVVRKNTNAKQQRYLWCVAQEKKLLEKFNALKAQVEEVTREKLQLMNELGI